MRAWGNSHSGFPPVEWHRSPAHSGQHGSWQNRSRAQKSLGTDADLGVMDRGVIVDAMSASITEKGERCGQGKRGNG